MPGTAVVAFGALFTVGPVGLVGSSNSSFSICARGKTTVSVLSEWRQLCGGVGKLVFLLPPLQFWAVLGLPEVSQRWGEG